MASKSLVEIKPIVPTQYKPLPLEAIIKRLVAEEVVEVRTDYERTVKSWNTKPTFIIKYHNDRTSAQVYTTSKIYEYVDAGTPPHLIKPKRPGYPLSFNVPTKAKTRVMQINSYSGSKGTKPVKTMVVHHPGTKARKFTPVILRAHKRMFARRLQQEINRRAKLSG